MATDKAKRLAAYIAKNPADSFSKFALALEFLKTDDVGKARVLFEDIRNKDPEYVGVYYHLGKVYELLGQLKDAKNTYERGLQVATDQNELRTKAELNEALSELKFEME